MRRWATGRARPTLRDVAARAGRQLQDRLRVVNDEPGASPGSTERVRRAVDELGFRPKSVRASAPAIPHGVDRLLLEDVADPFSATLPARGGERGRRPGAAVFWPAPTATPSENGRWSKPSPPAARRRPDPRPVGCRPVVPRRRGGLGDGGRLRRPRRRAASTSTRSWRPTRPARRRAVGHLAAHGHTRIAFLGDGQRRRRPRRLPGRAEAAGLVPDPALVVADLRRRRARRRRGGHAVPHDRPADGAVHRARCRDGRGAARAAPARAAAARRGGRVRRLRHRGPALPGNHRRRPGPAGIGRRAAYLLFARMAGEAGPPATHHVPTVLIPRGSGELPPPPR